MKPLDRFRPGGTPQLGTISWPTAVLLMVAVFSPGALAEDSAEAPAAHQFSEAVAPLLATRCLGCHNSSEAKGELDLSGESTLRAGGESGLAVEPGDPEQSLLWQRISADEMPPEAPLSDDEKLLLRRWIAAGAPWSGGAIDPFAFSSEARAGYDWWSLQKLANPPPPTPAEPAWGKNAIDAFIRQKLAEADLAPAAEADARALVRRLYFDLLGLPPSAAEMASWTSRLETAGGIDDAAYRELVEALLDSPHYGERWARHWLDVVRFGESQGFERNLIRENAWRYRDWVVQAFNRDLPYDEFVRQQIAGDVLYPDDLDALLATGYHVSGTWDQVGYLEGSQEMQKVVRQDGLEDLVATLGQAFLGLTIHCARCHDHKFDPITQREYYQVAALLGGVTQESQERQGITATPKTAEYQQWAASLRSKQETLQELELAIRQKYAPTAGDGIAGLQVLYRIENSDASRPAKLVQADGELQPPIELAVDGESRLTSAEPATRLSQAIRTSGAVTVEAWLTPGKLSQSGPARIVTLSKDSGERNFTLGQDGRSYDVRLRTTTTDPNGLPSLKSPDVTAESRQHVVFTFDSEGVWRLFVDAEVVAEKKAGGELSNWNVGFRLAIGDELSGGRPWDGRLDFLAFYSEALSGDQIRKNFESQSQHVRAGEAWETLLARASSEERTRHTTLAQEVAELRQADPTRQFAGVAHVIIPKQPPVFHRLERGNHTAPQEVVSPAGLAALASADLSADFGLAPGAPEGERRAKLARWLTDPRNPLTARVMVNRLWHYHFGQGIVDTPSDFGFAGGRPSHPELLDFLATRFVESGWKIKDMHRLMVTSATYRQASNVMNAQAAAVDADNRLRWRGGRRRLEGEAVRDAVLAISGTLDRQLGGPSYRDIKVEGGVMGTNAEFTTPLDVFAEQGNRRTLYRLWARSGSHPLLEALDCPDPSVMAPRRTQTITPIQSLALLHNGLMEKAAAQLAQRISEHSAAAADSQITAAYSAVLCREPQPRELELSRDFVQRRGLEQLCLILFNTNEFLFVE